MVVSEYDSEITYGVSGCVEGEELVTVVVVMDGYDTVMRYAVSSCVVVRVVVVVEYDDVMRHIYFARLCKGRRVGGIDGGSGCI